MAARIGWTSVVFGANQVLRLLNNVLLARLLAPSLFGLMTIVNAIRVGVELLSDLGINQNIVSSPQGHTKDFYDTAWTLQVLRGVLLGSIAFALSQPLAAFFRQPELAVILPVASLMFVFSGLMSTSGGLLQKQINVVRAGLFELCGLTLTIIAQVSLAIVTPTIWALVLGSVVGSAISLIASYLLIPGIRHRFFIDKAIAGQIISFGKWIFLSSIIYFLAMNFDRLYFARQITLTELGIFSIARALTDMFNQFAVRASNMVLFPTVAAWQISEVEVRSRVLRGRRLLFLAAALGLGAVVSVSDLIIQLLYDDRYLQAGAILPLLLIGVWFSILCTINDSIMLGTKRPAYPALSSGAKLLFYVVALPLTFHLYGFMMAVLVLSLGEVVRYIALWTFSRRQHLGFGRDDLVLSLIFFGSILAFRELLALVGLTGGITTLFPLLNDLQASIAGL
ncbi:oligosaccharide flippase family protein [Sphingomonas daechungensis]|uniref:oligosaccharide flippase family protein n=1 Tax=Sphingomonas daechungensis TaxID=1176646 RepID=UPI0031EEBA02